MNEQFDGRTNKADVRPRDETWGETNRAYSTGKSGKRGYFKVSVVISYFSMVLLVCLLLAGAVLTSMLVIVNDRNAFVNLAGTYTISGMQQKAIQQKIQTVANDYHFDQTAVNREISVAALSLFSQNTAEYWFDVVHGTIGQSAPVWDIHPLMDEVRTNESFRQYWPAAEQDGKAQEAAEKIGIVIQTSVFPLDQTSMTSLFQSITAQGYIARAVFLDIGILIAILLLIVVVMSSQRKYPFYRFWFFGVSACTAALGSGVVAMQMQNQTLQNMLARYNEILSYFGVSVMDLFIKGLQTFSTVYLLLGGVMLILFFSYRYQYFHKTHHELSSLI